MARSSRVFGSVAIGALLIGPLLLWRKADTEKRQEQAQNFELGYSKPKGWIVVPHGPQTVFAYRNPKTRVTLRGATHNIVDETNPTPELDRDTVTRNFAEVTVENLGWKAEILDTIDFNGGSYRIIRREGKDRTVVTGIAVRGNTTVLITLSGIGAAKKNVDSEMPHFRDFLASMSLKQKVMR